MKFLQNLVRKNSLALTAGAANLLGLYALYRDGRNVVPGPSWCVAQQLASLENGTKQSSTEKASTSNKKTF